VYIPMLMEVMVKDFDDSRKILKGVPKKLSRDT
jgi:hypothetical protein